MIFNNRVTRKKQLLACTAFASMALMFSHTSYASDVDSTNKSVFNKSRPDYEAKGVKLGAFKLNTTLDVQEKYDDNIFASNTNEREDFITTVKPAVSIQSDWSRHLVTAKASGDFSFYHDFDDENASDYAFSLGTRLDAFRETYVYANVGYEVEHQERGSPEANDSNSTEPTEYATTSGNLDFYRGVNRISLSLKNNYKQIDFDNGVTSTGTIVNNNNRDRDVLRSTARIAYELSPGYNAFVSGSYNNRDYTNLTTGATDRGSEGYEFVVGTAINISGKTRGEIYAGYIEQQYDDSTLQDIDGVNFGANLLWNVTPLTSLKANIIRSVEETTTTNSSGYLSTAYSLSAEHELRRNILLGANVVYANNDYQGAAAGVAERDDDVTGAGAEIRYLLNDRASINLKYNYQDRDSNIAGSDYSSNAIMVGLKLKM